MKKRILTGIRLILSAGLLYLVYGETGPWTVTALALALIFTELESL